MATYSCQGRGSAASFALLVFMVCGVRGGAAATLWTVGDSSGWTENFDYSTWTSGKTFVVGDTLFFPYAANTHDVAQVSEADYNSCTSSNAMQTYTGGNNNVTLNETGTDYFICTYPGHCANQMKLAVTVSAAGTSTSTPPSNSSGSSSPPSIVSPEVSYLAAIALALWAGLFSL